MSNGTFCPAFYHNFLLKCAAWIANVGIMNLLLSNSCVDPAVLYNNMFGYVVKNGNDEMVNVLLTDARFCPPSKILNSALHSAVEMGHVRVVEHMLSNGRVTAGAKKRALERARLWGRLRMVNLLIEDGETGEGAPSSQP